MRKLVKQKLRAFVPSLVKPHLSGRAACRQEAGNASQKLNLCGLQPVAKMLTCRHLTDPHPTPTGADDERSETFAPPFGWAVACPSETRYLSPDKPHTQSEPQTYIPNKAEREAQNLPCRAALPVAENLTTQTKTLNVKRLACRQEPAEPTKKPDLWDALPVTRDLQTPEFMNIHSSKTLCVILCLVTNKA